MLHDLYLLHAVIALRRGAPANGEYISKCVWCDGNISFAENSEMIPSSKPSWMWAAIHGLAKYCKSAFAEENKLDTVDNNVLTYAVNIYKSNTKVHDSHLKANLSTVSLLVEHNAQVNDSHIFTALKTAPPKVLNLLLQGHSSGKLRLKVSSGEIVGPFWVLMCEGYKSSYFRRTVDYLVRRGESLNVNCEPVDTALHAPLWSMSVNILWRFEVLLKKGADPNISGPAGTPLRLAWKRALSGRVEAFFLSDYQRLMKLLLDYGAIIDWVDEDGVAPTEKEIRAYCDLSGAKILAFSGKESLK
jgi:ankyrin repeat protein